MNGGHRKSAAGEHHIRSERMILFWGFLLALSALILFARVAEEMIEGDTVQFDSDVRSVVHQHSTAQVTSIMKALTILGSSTVMAPLSILTLVLCYIRREFHSLKALGATFAGALLLELLLKEAFHRPRPVPFFDLPAPASFSFPSGHALFSFCFFAGIAVILPPRLKHAGAKLALWLITSALIVGIGFSRVYLGVHYPSDVLAGYLAGLVWVATVRLVNELHRRNIEREWTPA